MPPRRLMGGDDPLASLDLGEAERLAIGYAPARLRVGYQAVLALDTLLRRLALSAREPLPAQIRLAWWRDALQSEAMAQSHPVLAALAARWGGDANTLVGLVDAWEEVAVGDMGSPTAAEALGSQRAGVLAACAEMAESAKGGALIAARCWTLAELSNFAPDPAARSHLLERARADAVPLLPRTLRPLAVLAGLARRAAAKGGGPLLGDRLSPLVAIRLGIFGR